jgi:Ca2+-transporting ATPase
MIATAIFIGQVLIVQFGGEVFRTVPLSFGHWFLITLATSTVLWAGELVRYLRRSKNPEGALGT